MAQPWRLIPRMTAPGVTHMAIDAWLLEQLQKGTHPPTLRFYDWSPVALSLGYHQKDWPQGWRHLRWQGKPVDLVRRPTGGRAVLHQGDFTYALTLPMENVPRQGLYRQTCDGLIAAWQRLGVSLSYGTAGGGYRHQPGCFDIATTADLVTPAGYKLIGSAQLRRDRYLLQQGTMRLWPSAVLYRQAFEAELETSLIPSEMPECPSTAWLDDLSKLIVEELAQSLGVVFSAQPLTMSEHQQAIQAYGAQYAIP